MTGRPTTRQTIDALRLAGGCLGIESAYQFAGRFFFPLDDRWALAISSDDAGRFRVEACRDTLPVATMWVFADDLDRLADLVVAFRSEVQALARL